MMLGKKWTRPKSFSVAGRVFRISYVVESSRLDADDMGCADYDLGEITVRTHLEGHKLPEDSIRETLFHELKHVEFWAAGLSECATDERLVSQTSNVALQIWESLR